MPTVHTEDPVARTKVTMSPQQAFSGVSEQLRLMLNCKQGMQQTEQNDRRFQEKQGSHFGGARPGLHALQGCQVHWQEDSHSLQSHRRPAAVLILLPGGFYARGSTENACPNNGFNRGNEQGSHRRLGYREFLELDGHFAEILTAPPDPRYYESATVLHSQQAGLLKCDKLVGGKLLAHATTALTCLSPSGSSSALVSPGPFLYLHPC
jgi:hypothetical protein